MLQHIECPPVNITLISHTLYAHTDTECTHTCAHMHYIVLHACVQVGWGDGGRGEVHVGEVYAQGCTKYDAVTVPQQDTLLN
jgi:hypothetical protein